MMRYLFHLLPIEHQRRAFDDLRARLAAAIGSNRALDYPTAHVTLVWSIQDDPAAPAPIDGRALAGLLAHCRDGGPLPLAVRREDGIARHLLLALGDTPALAGLRRRLYADACAVVGETVARGPGGGRGIMEQTWPHLTLAQEIAPAARARGADLLAREGDWLDEPIVGAELALLARDVAAGEPYRIVERVPLL